MAWTVEAADEFVPEFRATGRSAERIDRSRAAARSFRAGLRRSYCDTLKGSRFANMKELRFAAAGGVWRVAFAFDPRRSAILLVAGDKSGGSEARFYKRLIATADQRFAAHLLRMKGT